MDFTVINNDTRNFKVIIDEGEVNEIKKWVLLKRNIETGGDLFGLWLDRHTAVVQFVLGPGQNCARTSVSFYQDIDYLQEAGSYLTKKQGLCDIGQWHSHHRMSLPRPSGGDENTVWGNMPALGLERYIVFICTIEGYYSKTEEAVINCFLFEINKFGQRYPVLKGNLQIHNGQESPFRLNPAILNVAKKGEERRKETKHNSALVGKPTKRKGKGLILKTTKCIWLIRLFSAELKSGKVQNFKKEIVLYFLPK